MLILYKNVILHNLQKSKNLIKHRAKNIFVTNYQNNRKYVKTKHWWQCWKKF